MEENPWENWRNFRNPFPWMGAFRHVIAKNALYRCLQGLHVYHPVINKQNKLNLLAAKIRICEKCFRLQTNRIIGHWKIFEIVGDFFGKSCRNRFRFRLAIGGSQLVDVGIQFEEREVEAVVMDGVTS